MISIIIPVYNAESYLDKCIESVITQTYTDWECILINDGSKDNSASICDSWVKKDSRISVIHQPNKGVSAARNRGIKESKGEFIVFIDSDDWVEPNYLSDMLNAILKYNSDLVITGQIHHKPKRNITIFKPQEILFFELTKNSTSDFIKNIGFFYGPYSKIFKANIIKNNNIRFPIDLSLGEDLSFNFQYLEYTKSILCLPVANYNYRILNSGSLTSIYRDNTFEIHYHLFKIRKIFFQRKNMWNNISKKYLYNQLWGIIYDALFNKKDITLTYIQSVLNITEITEIKNWEKEFVSSRWIKYLIKYKQSIPLYLILKFKNKQKIWK